jgi:hypothetical protein
VGPLIPDDEARGAPCPHAVADYVVACDGGGPGVREDRRAKGPDQGALSRTVWAEQGHHIARLYVEAYAIERLDRAEPLADLANSDPVHGLEP